MIFYVFSFQRFLNQLNRTSQSKVMIVLSEHTFETLIWSYVLLADLPFDVSLQFHPF
jgi:hypothetical protein